MKKLKLLTLALVAGLFFACGGNSDRGFKETEGGLKYKFHEQSGGEMAQIEDVLSMQMVYRLNDSILFDTREGEVPMFLELIEPEYPGDIYEGLALMAIGDSVTFIIDAEDFFLITASMFELPPFVNSGDMLYFDVKLNAALDEEGFMAEQQRIMEQQMQANEQRALDEDGLLEQYLLDEGISVAPRESGLYFVEKEKGSGQPVTPGSKVFVHYEGRLLDGTVFDSSYERDEPLDFEVGTGQVIPGWDEGLSLMNVGGKALLVIPSHLGYGDRGAGELIPPYSTLVFEVEVVDVQ